jgi:hypothetical protein
MNYNYKFMDTCNHRGLQKNIKLFQEPILFDSRDFFEGDCIHILLDFACFLRYFESGLWEYFRQTF